MKGAHGWKQIPHERQSSLESSFNQNPAAVVEQQEAQDSPHVLFNFKKMVATYPDSNWEEIPIRRIPSAILFANFVPTWKTFHAHKITQMGRRDVDEAYEKLKIAPPPWRADENRVFSKHLVYPLRASDDISTERWFEKLEQLLGPTMKLSSVRFLQNEFLLNRFLEKFEPL